MADIFIDFRGRKRKPDINGRVNLFRPTKKIEDVFDVQTISWAFIGIDNKTGKRLEVITASRTRELEYKAANVKYYTFL